ncbi:helix-turn-helix transcriptional regulator [Paenibacillus amylolyticus]|nr:helix-turn-helix transcriptional regulator [Paenibacillus amylolyticus]
MNNINQEVGKKIRNFRKWRGLTIQQLADQIFKSKGTLSKYESGDITLDLVTLHHIANAQHSGGATLVPRTKACISPDECGPVQLFQELHTFLFLLL